MLRDTGINRERGKGEGRKEIKRTREADRGGDRTGGKREGERKKKRDEDYERLAYAVSIERLRATFSLINSPPQPCSLRSLAFIVDIIMFPIKCPIQTFMIGLCSKPNQDCLFPLYNMLLFALRPQKSQTLCS